MYTYGWLPKPRSRIITPDKVGVCGEPTSEQNLKDQLKDLKVAQKTGTPNVSYVGILIDGNLLSESITAPHIRDAPVNKDLARQPQADRKQSRQYSPLQSFPN